MTTPSATPPDLMTPQQARIAALLLCGGTISVIDAWPTLGIANLPQRIAELKDLGYAIHSKKVDVTNRWGEVTRVAEYSIMPEQQHDGA